MCIFTTHTPIEAGHDKFSYKLKTEKDYVFAMEVMMTLRILSNKKTINAQGMERTKTSRLMRIKQKNDYGGI